MKIYPFGNEMLKHVPPWNKVLQNKLMNKLNAEKKRIKFTFCEDLSSFFLFFVFIFILFLMENFN